MKNFIKDFEKTKSLMSNNENSNLAIDCSVRLVVCGKLVCRILSLLEVNEKISKEETYTLFGYLYISPRELYSIYKDSKNNKKSFLICNRIENRLSNAGAGEGNDLLTLTEIRKKEPNFMIW